MTAPFTAEREAEIRAWRRRVDGAQSPYPHRDHVDTLLAIVDSLRAERDAAIARAETAEAALARSVDAWDSAGMQGRDGPTLVRERDEARARAERAGAVLTNYRTKWLPDAAPLSDDDFLAIRMRWGTGCFGGCDQPDCVEHRSAWRALHIVLAATPATLAGQVRARVLREAADALESRRTVDALGATCTPLHTPETLRALADDAEKESR